jgi:hypothetical protein
MSPSPIPLGTVGFYMLSQYQQTVFKVSLVIENQRVPVLAHCGQRGMRCLMFTNIFCHGLPLLDNYWGWAVLVLPTHILYVFPLAYGCQATSIKNTQAKFELSLIPECMKLVG